MRRPPGRLYHLAEASNLDSIQAHGLMSAESLLVRAGLVETERAAILRGHRPDCLRLPNGVVVRDQRPMPPAALSPALDDGMDPGDWYALLNGFVFLWPDRARMERHWGACGGRPQVLLTFDGAAVLDQFGDQAFVSPINTGNARRKAARRGRGTLVPYRTWLREGWPAGQPSRPPAEVLFACTVPARAPYLVGVSREPVPDDGDPKHGGVDGDPGTASEL
ncbi:hypothetical protein MKL09_18375 [Methylobacterium sp. J-048]|uniref:DUF7002 family protein n=1 Tax=Methylobacterium sp. J-048 TaxID=2836635 RepID=UPI001FBB1804|nr:hypothetical protein [Methylobacterium sp. J-048]MCJ2058507.1 hypothetical protein [Methylobacterium sp. J-048]